MPTQRQPPSAYGLPDLLTATLNIRSINSKAIHVSELIVDHHLDILALTETWHSHGDDLPLRRSVPPGYSLVDLPRDVSATDANLLNHGGLAIIYLSSFTARRI